MEENRKKSGAGYTIFLCTSIAASLGTGALIGMDGQLEKLFRPGLGVFGWIVRAAGILFLCCLGEQLQVIAHESGHFLFGLATGYRFVSFRIGKVMLVRRNGIYSIKRLSVKGTGGQCLMAPPEPYRITMPYMLYNFGGIIANSAVSAICLIIYANTRKYAFSFFLLTTALVGIIFALLNGIPILAGQIANDGYNALSIKKNENERRYFYIQLQLNAKLTDGVRLKEMPEEWFDIPSPEDMDYVMCAGGGLFAYLRAVDEMNFGKAEKIGQYVLENADGMLPVHRGMLTLEMLFLELIGRNRAEKVENMITEDFKHYLKMTRKRPSVLRVLYAYDLMVKGNEEAAGRKRKEFERRAARYPNECEIKGERELMDYVLIIYRKRCERAQMIAQEEAAAADNDISLKGIRDAQ